jgi:thiosulfate/3-mercaptopyruvate sulfurtransferase
MKYQFVDCRWELGKPERGRELYLQGHIPGASFLDVERELSAPPGGSEGGRHPLPAADDFSRAAGRAGIGPGVLVVAYDQGMSGGAARLWWLLRHFGHEEVAVLDGGIDAWLGPLANGEEEIEEAEFSARERTDDVASAEELLERLGGEGLVLVDARAAERYRGEVEPIDSVAGHIPGAVNVPYTTSERMNEIEGDDVVVYCGSGITAAVDVLQLARAGRRARLYPGSWSEWSSRGLPVERG